MMYDSLSPFMSELAHLIDIGYEDFGVIQERMMPLMEEIVHDTSIFYTEEHLETACSEARDEAYKWGYDAKAELNEKESD